MAYVDTAEFETELMQLVAVTAHVGALAQQMLASIRTTSEAVETPKEPLYLQIRDLITASPRRFADLKKLTGAEDNRIKSMLIRLQRDDKRVVNLGNQRRAVWALVSEEFLAKLRGK